MKITMYLRTYPVAGAPVTVSLVPFSLHQKHTYTFEGKVYDAVRREFQVTVPEGAVVDTDKKLLAWTGDKGYVGRGMVTPIKKIEGVELLDWQKAFNTAINQTRAVVERVIANLKTWRILHTDYRRPLATFDTTISAVVGLQFYSLA